MKFVVQMLLLLIFVGSLVAISFLVEPKKIDNIVFNDSNIIHGLIINIPGTNMTCKQTVYANGFYYCNIDNITKVN